MWSRFKTGQYSAFTGAKPSLPISDSMSPLGKMMLPPDHTMGGNYPAQVARTTGGNAPVSSVVKVPGGYSQERLVPGAVNGRADLASVYSGRINYGEIPTLFGNRRIPGR